MTIIGDKCHIEIDYGVGRIAIFEGELGVNGFYADKDSMKWKVPHDQESISEADRTSLISMIEKENAFRECRIIFDSETISREAFISNFLKSNLGNLNE